MSLGGLALGVGMLVDNAIVVLESIYRRRQEGDAPARAAERGASEVGMAVFASTLTTVAVFLPVVFLEGIAAQLFRDQALTVSFSLLASLAVALTLIPMLSAMGGGRAAAAGTAGARRAAIMRPLRPASGWRALRPLRWLGRWMLWGLRWTGRGVASGLRWALFGLRRGLGLLARGFAWLARPLSRAFDGGLGGLLRVYPAVLRWSLRARGTVVAATLLLFLFSLWLIPRLGFDLIPAFSQGEFSFAVELPEGTPLEVTDRHLAEVQTVLDGDPRVKSYSSVAGAAGLSLTTTGTEGENAARIQVRMAPGTSAEDETAVAALLRSRLEASGLASFEFERPTYFTFRTPVEVEIYGDSLAELHTAAVALEERLGRVPGLVDVTSSAELGNPELQVSFNREQLVRLGLDLGQVAETVRSKVQGNVATHFLQGDREIDILVRSVEVGRASVADVRELIVGQRGGVPIPLAAVADVRLTEGPSEIRRLGQKRAAVVSANVSGRDMGGASADVRRAIAETPLAAGVAAGLSGQEEEMSRSLRSLLMAAALAIFLVYLVMASQFESLLHPFVIIFTLPLGLIGAVLALGLAGMALNVVAMIGMVMLAGIVVNNAIVLIDTVNQLRAAGMPRERALVEAGVVRLRPILMTTLTTVLGLLPMALGLGDGAELRAPLAVTVIGGLTLATALTLIVIPVVYTLLDRKVYTVADAAPAAEESAAGAAPPLRPAPEA
jgi:HAE1 family hydrophobic/amphiphilic exporter-1